MMIKRDNRFFYTLIFILLSAAFFHNASAAQVSPEGFDPAAVSRQAEEAMGSRRFSEAVELYREMNVRFPDIPGLKMNLGMALYFSGKPIEALASLEKVTEMDPSLEAAWFFSGMANMDMGRPDQAVKFLSEYMNRKPLDNDARQIFADALSSLNRNTEAVEEYQKVLKAEPGNPKAWFGIGTSFEALSNQNFDKLDSIAPESGYWLALVADSRVVQKQYSSAYFLYRKALELQPRLRGVHYSISRIYRESEKNEWAAAEEKKEGDLGAPDCSKEKLVCSFLQADFSRIVAEGDVNKPEDLYWIIQAYNQLAVASFTKLNELPSSYEVHALRARMQENLGRYWESVSEWKQALEYVPGDVYVQKQLAINLYLNRNYPDSNKIVQELLIAEPDDARLNFLAGDILVYEQQAEKAVPYLVKAVKADDTYITAHSSLGRAYMSIGKAAEAIPHLEKALKNDEDGSIHYQLGRAYQRSGKTDLAKEIMGKYQEIRKVLDEEDKQLSEDVRITAPGA
jgi:tetratricopeptide (TPR) repeat protein